MQIRAKRLSQVAIVLALFCAGIPTHAQEDPDAPGTVRLPLDVYNQLVNKSRTPTPVPVPVPASYALGKATVTVNVSEAGPKATASVTTQVRVQVFEDEWTLVPLLSSGTAIQTATVGGSPVQLVSTPAGFGWSSNKAGTYDVQIVYSVDASKSDQGMSLGVPVPEASAITLSGTLPGSGLDVAVIPSAGLRTTGSGSTTSISATVPTTRGIQLSWRLPRNEGHTMSRAFYTGSLRENAVSWNAEYGIELFSDETVTLPLVPSSVTLNDIKVDGKTATILTESGKFATMVKGRGTHRINLSFQVPVIKDDGPPHIDLQIPAIPVSRFELSLPGKKEITVNPASNVLSTPKGGSTVATMYVPMTSSVTMSWAEAVPEAVKTELRANANIYHTVHADEGVLYARAMTVFDVSRGETNVFTLEVPSDVQVNDVRSDSGGVAEWIPNRTQRGRPYTISVFLDRQVKGQFAFDVYYERKLPKGAEDAEATPTVRVPLLKAQNVNRQRGMIALLSSKELTLKPVNDEKLSRVGENQLPAFVRQAVEMTIAHTFKYLEDAPELNVQPAPPERKEGKYDAQVDTLVSLGDVTLKGSASVELNVKSGGIMDLEIGIPADVNVLSLTAPSLRTYKVDPKDSAQAIDVQFTQEMEGQFRVEVVYERIMADGESELTVPTLHVEGADVEQGRIAVEALTAVEVQAAKTEQLSSLDVNELPQQLILKTTNPILSAYKYVHADPPALLTLRITRHREIDVQVATIDQANYRTLYTRDGLAVTTARFIARNSRKQFLKIELPEGSDVWSVFVDGKAEKPALAEPKEGEDASASNILIKIINSAEGFPVDVIYATEVSTMGSLGQVSGVLPRPDMVVTRSRWDVYLPDDLSYGKVDTNMSIIDSGTTVSREAMQNAVGALGGDATKTQVVEPLRIEVPTSGVRFSFEKLYANKAEEDAKIAIPYASTGGNALARLLTILAALLVAFGAWTVRNEEQRQRAFAAMGVGAVILVVTVGYFGTGLTLAGVIWLVASFAYIGVRIYQAIQAKKNVTAPPPPPEPAA